jgi:hypothetical protein
MKQITLFTIALTAGLGACLNAPAAEPEKIGPSLVYQTDNDFEWAKENLLGAIADKGLVLSATLHAATMLNRTGPDLGFKQQVYKDAETYLFCKADISHKLVAANGHNITLCPYAISVYTLTGKPGVTYYSYREPYTAEPAYKPILQLLESIVNDALAQ